MAFANYDDVLGQLRDAGLHVHHLEVGTARPVRCKVEGDRERRGWYILHELPVDGGDILIVGSFGVWRGSENHAQKVELRKREISIEQRAALKSRLAEDRRRADAAIKHEQERAADRATQAWGRLQNDGDCEYLDSKRVVGFGLRYTANGSAVLPLLDTAGRIHGLQFLRTTAQAKQAKRPAKEFWPAGLAKKGHFHLIGAPSWVVLVAEGYATAASLHMATGHPVAVAFDAGNLMPVADALRKRYPRTKILICADDDILGKCKHTDCRAHLVLPQHPKECPACGLEHGYTNAGVNSAGAASLSVNGAWLAPAFADDAGVQQRWLDKKAKLTDFNDLHVAEGLHVVRVQVEAKLSALRWVAQAAGAASTTTSGGGAKLRPMQSAHELRERFALVYGHSGTVFDRQEHCLLSLSDMRDACIRRDIHRAWMEDPERDMVRVAEVGFDPGGDDPQVTCNLWGGWPTTPQAGNCDRLLELLRYVCSVERQGEAVYQWILRWLAYPLQHPGAKMKSCLVLHGPQGTGKNLFFETVMAIYGQYGRVIGQDAVEDKFTDWASRKLFLIADEVAARSEVFHLKNKLKALITGDWIRINPKNVAAYDERNHVNLVFLSNEAMPVALEEDDRRHCVVWTPAERDRAFYDSVLAEIREGGAAALHDYLLHLDLGDFRNGTRPPDTEAKAELISLGLDSPQRFWDDANMGEIPGIKPMPALVTDWYEAYKRWCNQNGHRAAPQPKFVNALARKRGTPSIRKRYLQGQTTAGPHAVLMMGNNEPPPDKSEQVWLGEQIAKFRQCLGEFKGSAAA
jgi:putative DNA primase/helicase